MSEGHILFNSFLGQPVLRSSHSLSSSFFYSFFLSSLSSLFLAGDIGQLKLPEGMQTVDFGACIGLKGTVESYG